MTLCKITALKLPGRNMCYHSLLYNSDTAAYNSERFWDNTEQMVCGHHQHFTIGQEPQLL